MCPTPHNCPTTKLREGKSADEFTEVTLLDQWNNAKRHNVNLVDHTCSCRQWQLTGKPCKHALAWILSNRGTEIPQFVHDYYSVAKFRAAYEVRVEPMPDRSDWPQVELGFKVWPPKLGRAPGRPKKLRIRGCLEKNATKKKVKCKRCGEKGHLAKTCKLPECDEGGVPVPPKKTNKRPLEGDEAGTSAGPSKKGKKSTPKKKMMQKKRKKTPKKKKKQIKETKKAESAPPAKVVRSLKELLQNL